MPYEYMAKEYGWRIREIVAESQAATKPASAKMEMNKIKVERQEFIERGRRRERIEMRIFVSTLVPPAAILILTLGLEIWRWWK